MTQEPNGILDDGGDYDCDDDDDDDDKEGCDLIALRHYSHHEEHGTVQSHSWHSFFLLGMSQVWRSDS